MTENLHVHVDEGKENLIVMTVRPQAGIQIGDDITVYLMKTKGSSAQLLIKKPKETEAFRLKSKETHHA